MTNNGLTILAPQQEGEGEGEAKYCTWVTKHKKGVGWKRGGRVVTSLRFLFCSLLLAPLVFLPHLIKKNVKCFPT